MSFILFFILIVSTFYIHYYLTKENEKDQQRYNNRIKIPSYRNYNEILIDTPLASPEAELGSGSISFKSMTKSVEDDDDILSISSDTMSMLSLEENETLSCNKGKPVEMPGGYDNYQRSNDTAKHSFSSQEQMRVFDKHSFVKDIGNNRVNVDTNGSTSLPTIRNPENEAPCEQIPVGFGSLAGYGTMMAGYGNDIQDGGYMSGVVPYQG